LNRDQQNALIGIAGTLAVMAVTQSPKLVEQGLQGLALGGGDLDNLRNDRLLTRAARKVGRNYRAATVGSGHFRRASILRPNDLAAFKGATSC
jgi:hypothetical protein